MIIIALNELAYSVTSSAATQHLEEGDSRQKGERSLHSQSKLPSVSNGLPSASMWFRRQREDDHANSAPCCTMRNASMLTLLSLICYAE